MKSTEIDKIPLGAFTALVTPFDYETQKIDWPGIEKLMEFQASRGVSGIVPAGTTGESPTLSEREHMDLLSSVIRANKGLFILSGCGSNSTQEATKYVDHVAEQGGKAVLLVDSYYNGPSSLELRREYYEPIAKAFPGILIVPYIIPGRTGCQLLPEDLRGLALRYPNVCAVKEATGSFSNMVKTRKFVPEGFQIFSGDDGLTHEMMKRRDIRAAGVISVVSNVAPSAVQEMCQALISQEHEKAENINATLKPLFDIVTVCAERCVSSGGNVVDKFRNPLPIKTAMNILGMPAGPCRQPLGKMSVKGAQIVIEALRQVNRDSPSIFAQIEEFFGVNIKSRLANDNVWLSLCY